MIDTVKMLNDYKKGDEFANEVEDLIFDFIHALNKMSTDIAVLYGGYDEKYPGVWIFRKKEPYVIVVKELFDNRILVTIWSTENNKYIKYYFKYDPKKLNIKLYDIKGGTK